GNMRALILFVAAVLASAQPRDAAFPAADRAYTALRARDYDVAVPAFLAAIEAAPARADIRKDLAYTYLKIGEPTLARDQFREARRLDPADTTAALEYAFLCYETKQQAEARRVFDRLRRTGNATAEQAFHNIDDPLAAGIARWQKAIQLGADHFSDHFELATLAEQRDELALAATHFERAWRLIPDRRTVLVDLGRVWQAMGRAWRRHFRAVGRRIRGRTARRRNGPRTAAGALPVRQRVPAGAGAGPGQSRSAPRTGLPAVAHGPRKRGRGRVSHSGPERAGRSAFHHATGLSALRARREGGRHAVVRPRARRQGRRSRQPRPRRSADAAGAAPAGRRRPPIHRRQNHGRAQHQGRIYEGCAEVPRDGARERPGRFRCHAEAGLDQQHPAPRRPGVSLVRSRAAQYRPPYRRRRRSGVPESACRGAALPHHGMAVSAVFHALARLVRLRPGQDRNQPGHCRSPLRQRAVRRRYPRHRECRQPG